MPADPWQDALEDIRSGWSRTAAAREEREENLGYFERKNWVYAECEMRREGETRRAFELRPKEYTYLTSRAVRTLSSRLYSPGPSRTFDDAACQTFLESVYDECKINALMGRADQWATLNGVCAIQAVAPGADEESDLDQAEGLIRLYLWGRHEFEVYFKDDDPSCPEVVVTRSIVPGTKRGKRRRKYQVWSDERYAVYHSGDFDDMEPMGTSVEVRRADEDTQNLYGVIPFSFVWHEQPVDRFDSGGGLGTPLRLANQELDRLTSELAELLQHYNQPKGFARNVTSTWRHTSKPGQFDTLPQNDASKEMGGEADVFYLQPSVDVASAWEHIDSYGNRTLEDLDVPLRLARASATSSPESGVAIIAQQAPLKDYTEARQVPYGDYEMRLARMICRAAGNYYGLASLANAAPTLKVDLLWPPWRPSIVSQEFLADLQWRQDMGIESPVGLVMSLYGMTEEQAIKHIERVAKQRKAVAALVEPVQQQQPTQGQQQDQATNGAVNDPTQTDGNNP